MRRQIALAFAVTLLTTTVAACTAAAPDQDPRNTPYARGQFSVPNPRGGIGADLCGLLSAAEKQALIGANPVVEPGAGGQCILTGSKGYSAINFASYNVDVASEIDSSDRPGHRDTISGNSAWISPSSGGCYTFVAVDPHPGGLAFTLGGNGTYTCDELRHATQLILDRLPPQP